MAVPGPAHAGIEDFTAAADLFEARTIDAPDVAVARRRGAGRIDDGDAAPGHGDFGRPAAIHVIPLVQRAINANGVLQAGAVPVQKAPALAAWMNVAAHAIENQRALRSRIEFGTSPPATAGLVDVLPDPEHFIDDVAGADLEFVIGVGSGDEDLEIVLLIDLRIAFGERAPDVGFLGGESEIEVVVIPEEAHAGVEPGGRAGHDLHERRRRGRVTPARLVEIAVDLNRAGRAVTDVMGDLVFGNHAADHRIIGAIAL